MGMPLLLTFTVAARCPQSEHGLAVAEAAEYAKGAGLAATRRLFVGAVVDFRERLVLDAAFRLTQGFLRRASRFEPAIGDAASCCGQPQQ